MCRSPSSATSCATANCGAYLYCHSCLDGSIACLNSPSGTCCGCVNGNCWSCDLPSECHLSEVNICRTLDTGGIAGVVVGSIVFVALVILCIVCCFRHRHRWHSGYSEVVVSPAPIVTPAVVPVPVRFSSSFPPPLAAGSSLVS